MTLPYEILTLIFQYLSSKELLQCQLTCRQWHEASLKQLYSELTIRSYEKTCRYLQSISNSSRLANYLKYIFMDKSYIKRKKRDKLLFLIIAKCPNILKIHDDTVRNVTPWKDIRTAAGSGQLSHLQCLPFPERSKDFEPYICTALALKKSLTTLIINDVDGVFKEDLSSSKMYPILRRSISDFSNLQTLELLFRSKHLLSHFDKLIDDCKNLKVLHINTILKTVVETEPKQLIKPHLNIHTFTTEWVTLLNNENELRYIMQKFPNLRFLEIRFLYRVFVIRNIKKYEITDVIADFVRYILDIPNCKVVLPLKPSDLHHAFANIKKLRDSFLTVNRTPIPNGITTFSLTEKSLKIKVSVTQAHEFFFSELSPELCKTIKSLDLSCTIIESNTESFNYVDLVQLCPFLEELIFNNMTEPKLTYNSRFQHIALKTLTLNVISPNLNLTFLQDISRDCPNLKQLNLQYHNNSSSREPITEIIMPYSSLDSIAWCKPIFDIEGRVSEYQYEAYIKLKTCKRVEFYHAVKDKKLVLINKTVYNKSLHGPCIDTARKKVLVHFDITCQNLKKISISKLTCYKDCFTWIF